MRLKDKVVSATFKVKLHESGVVTTKSQKGAWKPLYTKKG